MPDQKNGNQAVTIRCPDCRRNFSLRLNEISLGKACRCSHCGNEIFIGSALHMQLLDEIKRNLDAPQRCGLFLKPPAKSINREKYSEPAKSEGP